MPIYQEGRAEGLKFWIGGTVEFKKGTKDSQGKKLKISTVLKLRVEVTIVFYRNENAKEWRFELHCTYFWKILLITKWKPIRKYKFVNLWGAKKKKKYPVTPWYKWVAP